MVAPGVQLIPSPEENHADSENAPARFAKATSFIPMANILRIISRCRSRFRYYDTARVLAVALSRKFRVDRDIASQLPKVSTSAQVPAAFPCVRRARRAERATDLLRPSRENGQRMFRQYVNQGDIAPCIIVDDIIRSGHASKRQSSW